MQSDQTTSGFLHRQACDYMCQVWASAAQRAFGFDAATARRLAFLRWLRATGRLVDAAVDAAAVSSPEATPRGEAE